MSVPTKNLIEKRHIELIAQNAPLYETDAYFSFEDDGAQTD